MNITYELYRKTNDNTECLICNNKNATGNKRIRVYYDGELVDDEGIHLDSEGNEYFQIKNPYYNDNGGTFANRPKDAVRAIQDGYGDVFVKNECFGTGVSFETVYRYVDREYGSKAREQTLSVFEHAKFEYAIRFGVKGSKEGMRYVDKNHQLISLDASNGDTTTFTFSNENEAHKYKTATLKIAQDNFNKLRESITGSNDVTGLIDWISVSPFSKGGKYDKGHIVNAVFFAMLQEWKDNKTDTYTFEVVQTMN